MNRKYFGYAGLAVLIAICLCISSSVPVEARWVRCLVVSRWGLTCQQRNGWGWRSSTVHLRTCPAGHRYWHCHAASRNAHAAHVAPQPTPQRTPQSTQTQTTRQTTSQTTRQTTSQTTRQTQSQSPSRTPQRESTPRRQQPQQSCKKPTLTYKKWVIGQSATDFPSTTKPITFITNSKTRCTVKVEVSYNGSQPSNTCELTGVNFTVTMSHGFRVSGTPTVTPSGSGFSKVWKYEATFADSRSDANMSSSRKYQARGGTRISVTINATGNYSGGTVALSAQTVTQDQMDGLRQEYVDYNLPVLPKRKWFITRIAGRSPAGHGSYIVSPRDTRYKSSKVSGQEAFYNWGYYDYIIDSKTDHNYYVWTQWMDRLESGLKPTLITCRYRPPHHNKRIPKSARFSTHQYGYALDVRGKDKSPTQRTRIFHAAIDKTKRGDNPGKVVDAGAEYGYISKGHKHVHADWRPLNWDSMLASSPPVDLVDARNANPLPAISDGGNGGDDDDEDEDDDDDGADSGTSTDNAPAAPAAPSTSTPTTVACGNRWRGSGACTSGGRASSRTAHQSTCSAGHSYWSCNSTAVAWHATSYTCTRSGCGLTYTKCSKGNGSCRARRRGGGTYQWHN